jgi:ABC-type lipopolysaccharide export system ATPase subunit
MLNLQAVELSKTYRGRKVVDDVELEIGQGEVVGLLGMATNSVFIGFLKHILTYINPNGDHSCALRRQNKMNSGTYSMAR